jgi:Ni/Co efflux regulator RcnB
MKKVLMSLAIIALVVAPMTLNAENAPATEKAKTTCCKKDGDKKACCKKEGEKKGCCKKGEEKK